MKKIEMILMLCVLAGMAACSSTPSNTEAGPKSVVVSCTEQQSPAACLRVASEMCGTPGYELFNDKGEVVGVSDARNAVLTARCKT